MKAKLHKEYKQGKHYKHAIHKINKKKALDVDVRLTLSNILFTPSSQKVIPRR